MVRTSLCALLLAFSGLAGAQRLLEGEYWRRVFGFDLTDLDDFKARVRKEADRVLACWTLAVAAVTGHAAEGDADAGRRKTVTCNGCHAQANMKAVPNLGGQSTQYFIAAMRAYQEGKRGHATMRDVAKAYSDKELKNFAAYYAQLAAPGEVAVPDIEKPPGVQACESCHGPLGRAPANPDSAVLAGQKPAYLKAALREYREGARAHAVMQEAAGQLNDSEIDALAEFFAGLPGLVVK